jgi:hypothetical protein
MDAMSPTWNETDWDRLPDALQLRLADAAMRRAAYSIAGQAESLAGEIEDGALPDRGGAEALRLLAAVVRLAARDPLVPCGAA